MATIDQQVDQAAKAIEAKIAKYHVEPDHILFLDAKGNKTGEARTSDVLNKFSPKNGEKFIPRGTREIIVNGDLKGKIIAGDPNNTKTELNNFPVDIYVNGNVNIHIAYPGKLLAKGDIKAESLITNPNISGGNISMHSNGVDIKTVARGNVDITDGLFGEVAAKGWVKTGYAHSGAVDAPVLYVKHDFDAPKKFSGKTVVVGEKAWDDFTPPTAGKDKTAVEIAAAAAAIKAACDTAKGTFKDVSAAALNNFSCTIPSGPKAALERK